MTKQLITTIVVNKEEMISKEAFYLFVRGFGPFATGKNNPMYLLIMRNFFEVDGKTSRGNFHGHIDEKRAYSMIKEPGEFFYRYSSRNMDGICVVRVSRSKFPNGEWAKAAEILVNNKSGGWIHTVKDKPSVLYSSLAEYEAKNAEKVFKLVKSGTAVAATNFYASSMTMLPTASASSGYAAGPSSVSSYPSPSGGGFDSSMREKSSELPLLDRMVSGTEGLAPVTGPDGKHTFYSAMMTSPVASTRSPSSRRSHQTSLNKQMSVLSLERQSSNVEKPPEKQVTSMYSSQIFKD